MAKKKQSYSPKDHKRFLKIKRKTSPYRPVCKRIKDYKDVVAYREPEVSQEQGARCMDCGVPFCHWGCPIGNVIPEWNEALFTGKWKKAFQLLNETNNLPEMTGRVCPATCEAACVLGINDDPITIRENELAIIEYAFKKGYIKACPPKKRTGKKVAVIGSGPAGLACAQQLNRAGHRVTVFEQDEKVGGILRYGIPDFKLEKWVIDRRVTLLMEEGIRFKTNTCVGGKYSTQKLLQDFDAVCLTIGSREPRDLAIPGRELAGVYFAMDYLMQSNRCVAGKRIPQKESINAKGKRVVVVGGGDTGSDCVGTANRQGAACVVQIEVMPRPNDCRSEAYPWPHYPLLLKTTSSHEEGSDRDWAVLTKEFIGEAGQVKKLRCVRIEFTQTAPHTCPVMKEIPGSEFTIDADMVILAIGFVHPTHAGLLKSLTVKLNQRGNVETDENHMTSRKKVFSAGDAHRGQSLVVWGIAEGRRAAYGIDTFLMGKSNLPVI